MRRFLHSKPRKLAAGSCMLLLSAACFYLPSGTSNSAPQSDPVATATDHSGVHIVQVEDMKSSACTQPQQAAPVYDVNAITATIETLLVHQARIESEIQGKDFVMPAALERLKDHPGTAQSFAEEQIVLRSRQKTLNAQIDLYRAAAAQAQHEIAIMQAKAVTVDRQLALLRERLANVSSLVAKGIMPAVEKMTAEQNVAQYDIAAYDLQLSIAKTRQDKENAERNAAALADQRYDENAMELTQTRSKIKALLAQAKAANAANKVAAEAARKRAEVDCDQPHYSSYVVVPGSGSTVQVMKINAAGNAAVPASQVVISKE